MESSDLGIASAIGMELIFGDRFPFYEAVQTNLIAKNLQLQSMNLEVSLYNNELLSDLITESYITNESLVIVNDQISQLRGVIEDTYNAKEHEKLVKDLIFNLNRVFKKAKKIDDKLFVLYSAMQLLATIKENNLTTKEFENIEDKEYFQDSVDEFSNCINDYTKTEQNEVNTFIESYYVLKTLYNQLLSDRYQKNRIATKYTSGKVLVLVKPEILLIEKQLVSSINSDYDNISTYDTELINYCNSIEELPQTMISFFDEYIKYEIESIKYYCTNEYESSLNENKEIDQEFSQKRKLFEDIYPFVNDFLCKHPAFSSEFGIIPNTIPDPTYHVNDLDVKCNQLIEDFMKRTNSYRLDLEQKLKRKLDIKLDVKKNQHKGFSFFSKK